MLLKFLLTTQDLIFHWILCLSSENRTCWSRLHPRQEFTMILGDWNCHHGFLTNGPNGSLKCRAQCIGDGPVGKSSLSSHKWTCLKLYPSRGILLGIIFTNQCYISNMLSQSVLCSLISEMLFWGINMKLYQIDLFFVFLKKI